MWIEQRSKCKGDVTSYTPGYFTDGHPSKYKETVEFTKDSWYTTFYETWSDDEAHNKDMFRINNGWKKYKAIDNSLKTKSLSRAYYNIIFYSNIELRNELINEIVQ